MSKNLLLEACNAYIELFQESDMSPEDDCHELYTKMTKAVKSVDSQIVLLGKTKRMSFQVPVEFISMLEQVAKNREVKVPTVFNELVEQMSEELQKQLD